jgi:drug/metabolite transporter (DMT)-like permease
MSLKRPGQAVHPLLMIHSAVLLFGLSGLFGKFIDASPLYIVLGRTLFAAMALGIYARLISGTRLSEIPGQGMGLFFFQGALLAIHWYFFFLSIQISSVAVGLVTFSTFPLFVTFMEPLVFKEPLDRRDILTALVVFSGICLVIPEPDLSNQTTLGGFYGILSGLTFAILALVNRRNVRMSDPVAVAFYQNLFAAFCLVIPVILIRPKALATTDLPALIFLGVVCTALSHTLFISSLKQIRAQTASVITGLEPVYGIILAFFLLKEIPALSTLVGGGIIIGASIAAGYLASPKRQSSGNHKKGPK